jgi:hypothetical protein
MIELSPLHDAERVETSDESDRSELAESDEERDLPTTDVGAVDLEAYETSEDREGDRVRIEADEDRVWTLVKYEAASYESRLVRSARCRLFTIRGARTIGFDTPTVG